MNQRSHFFWPPAALIAFCLLAGAPDLSAQFQPPGSLGALAPENLAKPRPKPPFEIEFRAADPKSWEGEWKWTKRWRRVDNRDIAEVECLPELNQHTPTTKSESHVR